MTIGELWAVPITLRIVLIENLRRIAVRIVGSERARGEANRIADDVLGISGRSPEAAKENLQGKGMESLPAAFAVQLVQRLRHQGPGAAVTLQWLTERLEAQGTTPDDLVLLEHSLQASGNVTVRNIITSMRLISAYSWNAFFEEVSLVDEVLRADSLFAEMDFVTRDRYRHGLEELAKGAQRQELAIARLVIAKTEQARTIAGAGDETADWRLMDPGYYLISKGRRAFEAEIGFHPSLRQRLLRTYKAYATPAYLGSLGLATLLLAALPLLASVRTGVSPPWLLVLGILALFPCIRHRSHASQQDHERAARTPPPSPARTYRWHPAIVTHVRSGAEFFLRSETEVQEQIGLLELHYLANQDGEVRFALLTDWSDADAEIVPGDKGTPPLRSQSP